MRDSERKGRREAEVCIWTVLVKYDLDFCFMCLLIWRSSMENRSAGDRQGQASSDQAPGRVNIADSGTAGDAIGIIRWNQRRKVERLHIYRPSDPISQHRIGNSRTLRLRCPGRVLLRVRVELSWAELCRWATDDAVLTLTGLHWSQAYPLSLGTLSS